MKTFKQFESIRDKMTPKTDVDIYNYMEGLKPNEKLVKSAANGYLQGVKQALEDGADINANDGKVLGEASKEGHIEIVKYLLENGADVHQWYDYAIKWASSQDHNDIVKLLVDYGADVNAGNGDPLRSAIIHDNKELEEYLVDNGAVPEKVLYWAAGIGDLKTMNYLFSTYPDIDIHYENESILKYALLMRYRGAVDLLIKHGADPSKAKEWKEYNEYINESLRDKMTPKSKDDLRKHIDTLVPGERLRKGIEFGVLSRDEARDIIMGMDTEFRMEYGRRYGLLTPRELHELFVGLPLIDKIRIMNKSGYRYPEDKLIQEFLALDRDDRVKVLNRGVDFGLLPILTYSHWINAGSDRQHKDIFMKMVKKLRKFISKKIKVERGRYGYINPFMNESLRDKMTPKSIDDVKRSLENPDDLLELFALGCEKKQGFIIKYALDNGLDIHIDDDAPLRIASRYGCKNTVKYLLEHGANVHAADEDALMWAYELEDGDDIVDLLYKYGAMIPNMNESIRDMMTPKSEDDIISTFNNSDHEGKKRMVKHIVRNKFKYINDFYNFVKIVLGDGSLKRLSKRLPTYHGATDILIDRLRRYEIQKLFNELIEKEDINESLRDKMTPKSKEDIGNLIKKKIGVNSDIISFRFNSPIGDEQCKRFRKQLKNKLIKIEPIDNIHLKVTGNVMDVYEFYMDYFDIDGSMAIHFMKNEVINESVRDKMTPKPEEEITQLKDDIINYIKNIVKNNGGSISMGELQAESSPVYDYYEDKIVHLVETLYEDKVEIEEYDNLAETMIGEYYVDYEDLEPDTLLEIKDLIENGIEYEFINESVRDKMTPIDNKIIDDFIKKHGSESLSKAVDSGEVDIVRILINEKGMDVHNDNEDALRRAAKLEDGEMVKTLIECGADTEYAIEYHKNMYGEKYPWVIDEIIFYRKDLTEEYDLSESLRDKMTPKSEEEIRDTIKNSSHPTFALMYASEYDYPDIVKKSLKDLWKLYKSQPYMNIRNIIENALDLAIKSGSLEIIKILQKNGANLRYSTDKPIRQACVNGHLDVVKYLVEIGADIHSVDEQCLRNAVYHGYLDLTKFLLDNGADLHNWNDYCFRYAGTDEMKELLNSYKTNESLRDKMTPISEDDFKEKIGEHNRWSILMYGVQNLVPWIIERAIEKGADANLTMKINGELVTPIEHAAWEGDIDVIKLLLKHNVEVTDDAIQMALFRGFDEIAKLLEISKEKTHESNKFQTSKIKNFFGFTNQ